MGFQPLIFNGFTIGGSSGGGGGGVSSVALALPASVFNISGSPVTSSGTLTGTFISQSANTFFAGPNGSSGVPTFRLIVAADVPILNQNTTGTAANITATSNSTLTSLPSLALPTSQLSGSVALNQIASIANNTILGNNSGSSNPPTALTIAQVNAILPVFTSTLNGLVPLSGGGSVNFLRADGTWAAPSGSGSVTTVSVVSANGFAGSVANPTSTPAITLTTTITGILQGDGTSISAATTGDLTDSGTDGITITGGTGAVLGTGTSISQHVADATHNGYLSSANFNIFTATSNAAITSLTGDVTASGPGSATATIASTTVTGKLLTGFVSGPNSAVLATDSILQGIQKLQAQVSASGSGSVTSVALADASTSPIYTVSGSPVTTTGTLTITLASQSANTVFAAPNGSGGQPSFRLLVPADVPTLNQNTTGTASNITATSNSTLTSLPSLALPTSQLTGTISLTTQVSGVLPIANGGTNSSTTLNNNRIMVSATGAIVEAAALTDGQLLIGSTGAAPVAAAITPGAGITVTNGPGSIIISASAVGSPGDIAETSFTAADNQSSAADVTGLLFANLTVRSFDITLSIVRDNTYASYKLYGIQKAASWEMSESFTGDTTGIVFSITASGQVQYTSTSTGFTSNIHFRAITTSV